MSVSSVVSRPLVGWSGQCGLVSSSYCLTLTVYRYVPICRTLMLKAEMIKKALDSGLPEEGEKHGRTLAM